MKYHFWLKNLLILCVCLAHFSCAKDDSIFPEPNTSLEAELVFLPNPIGLAVNEAESQLYVINSNVDFYASQSTLLVLDVDASDPDAPVLTPSQALAIPNFAGQTFFDGVDALYVPFRESSESDSSLDVLVHYQLSAGVFSEFNEASVPDDPYGIFVLNDQTYLVSKEALTILDSDFEIQNTIDLTTAQDLGIEDAGSRFVEDVVVNALETKALVSNRGDNFFVVDLVENEVVQVVDGPIGTRDILIDANDDSRVYAIDAQSEAVLVFDFDLLPEPETIPESIDSSEITLASIAVGQDPNGILMDALENRLYVCNSFDDTVSVIDTVLLKEVARLSLNASDLSSDFIRDIQDPVALAVGTFDGERFLFVAGITSNSVAMIRTSDLKVVQLFPENDLEFKEDPRDED